MYFWLFSLFLPSFTMCDTELNSCSLSTLLQGAERYLRATLAREGNRILLTPQYCSGLASRATGASPRYVSNCAVTPTAPGVSAIDACSFAISSKIQSKLLLAWSSRAPPGPGRLFKRSRWTDSTARTGELGRRKRSGPRAARGPRRP